MLVMGPWAQRERSWGHRLTNLWCKCVRDINSCKTYQFFSHELLFVPWKNDQIAKKCSFRANFGEKCSLRGPELNDKGLGVLGYINRCSKCVLDIKSCKIYHFFVINSYLYLQKTAKTLKNAHSGPGKVEDVIFLPFWPFFWIPWP